MTAGARQDAPLCETVCEQLLAEHALEHGVMAKGDERDKLRQKLQEEKMEAVMPPRSHRKAQVE